MPKGTPKKIGRAPSGPDPATPEPTDAKSSRWGEGRMAFFALRPQLEAWLAGGGAMQAFFDDHAAELGITYSQFTKHTRRYLTKGKPHAKASRPTATQPAPQRKAAPPSDAAPSFHHDPITPPESDLI